MVSFMPCNVLRRRVRISWINRIQKLTRLFQFSITQVNAGFLLRKRCRFSFAACFFNTRQLSAGTASSQQASQLVIVDLACRWVSRLRVCVSQHVLRLFSTLRCPQLVLSQLVLILGVLNLRKLAILRQLVWQL